MSLSDKQQLPYIVTLSNMESKLVGYGAIKACVGVILSLVSTLLHPYEHAYSCGYVLCIHHTILHYTFHVCFVKLILSTIFYCMIFRPTHIRLIFFPSRIRSISVLNPWSRISVFKSAAAHYPIRSESVEKIWYRIW